MRTQITHRRNFLQVVCAFSVIMVCWLFANPMHAQAKTERTITGVVTSLDGPLFGANIVLKGTTIGVTSDKTGAFKFPKELKEDDVLVVSYLGYKNQEVTIGQVTTYIEPFLEDIPVRIYGAMRTVHTKESHYTKYIKN